jgi:DNA-binding transcriptional regulator PaaX
MEQKESNSAKHFYISLVKSTLRILAGVVLMTSGDLITAGALLVVAEGLGIAEEL